jgi:hypothetical protein
MRRQRGKASRRWIPTPNSTSRCATAAGWWPTRSRRSIAIGGGGPVADPVVPRRVILGDAEALDARRRLDARRAARLARGVGAGRLCGCAQHVGERGHRSDAGHRDLNAVAGVNGPDHEPITSREPYKKSCGFQDHRHSPSFRFEIAGIRAVPRSSARRVARCHRTCPRRRARRAGEGKGPARSRSLRSSDR